MITFTDCHNTGTVTAPDYSEYLSESGEVIWKNYLGGLIGNTCGEDDYSFLVSGCTYEGAERGVSNPEFPDVGQKK